MLYTTHSPEQTFAFGECLAQKLTAGDVLCLSGDLGAGKTLLTQGLAHGLGVDGPVTSPTFTVLNIYEGVHYPLYHFDLYRLEQAAELYDIGFDEYVYSAGISVIEWYDKFIDSMPDTYLRITLENGEDPASRRILVEACGERYRQLVEELNEHCRLLL